MCCFRGGIWDGAGMIIKAFIRDSEVSLAQRFPDALACCVVSIARMHRKSPKLLLKIES
jgi:hypothetical protein